MHADHASLFFAQTATKNNGTRAHSMPSPLGSFKEGLYVYASTYANMHVCTYASMYVNVCESGEACSDHGSWLMISSTASLRFLPSARCFDLGPLLIHLRPSPRYLPCRPRRFLRGFPRLTSMWAQNPPMCTHRHAHAHTSIHTHTHTHTHTPPSESVTPKATSFSSTSLLASMPSNHPPTNGADASVCPFALIQVYQYIHTCLIQVYQYIHTCLSI